MNQINGADSLFVYVGAVLVLIMTPALALFYGGMVRRKNVLSTTMHSYAAIVLVSIQWVIFGYSLSFGADFKGFLGGLNFFGLNGVGYSPNPDYAATIPHQAFMMFQLMFAIITVALVSGAIAERMKTMSFILFIILWTTLVYDPLAHWVWGVGGWIRTLGALDFAGGNVVHISSGVSGLAAALYLGARKRKDTVTPHNIPMTVLGAGLLLFGWYGFNAASALAVNGVAFNAFITTNTSAAAAAIGWSLFEYIHRKKVTALGVGSAIVAGLVAITPGAGFVTPMASIVIGFIGGIICFCGVTFIKAKFGYDDALDAFGCHGIGGMWGGIATGLFATKAVNSAGADGLFYGNPKLVAIQLVAILASIVFSFVMTTIIMKVIDAIMGVRVTEEEEEQGVDISNQGEEAYGGLN